MVQLRRIAAALLFAISLSGSVSADELLRWKLTAGETLLVDLAQKSEFETNLANKSVKMRLETAMELKWDVESVDAAGTARLVQSFTRLRLKMELPMKDPVEYDSAAQTKPIGPAKDVADAMGPLIGAKFFVSMSNRGEIVDVKLSDEASKLLDSPAAARWKETFTKDGLTDLLRQSAAVLPEKPVAPGDTWTVATTSKAPQGPLKLAHKYAYQGPEERDGKMLEKIAVQTTLTLEETKDKPRLTAQKHGGVLYFDVQAGRFVETEISQELATESPYRDTVVKAKAASTLKMKVTTP